jgi:hypothetical protein
VRWQKPAARGIVQMMGRRRQAEARRQAQLNLQVSIHLTEIQHKQGLHVPPSPNSCGWCLSTDRLKRFGQEKTEARKKEQPWAEYWEEKEKEETKLTWYHGTRTILELRERIVPSVGTRLNNGERGRDNSEIWLTTVLSVAKERAIASTGDGPPVVYVVEPVSAPRHWPALGGRSGDGTMQDEWVTSEAVISSVLRSEFWKKVNKGGL